MSKKQVGIIRTMATYIRRKLGFISDGLAYLFTPVSIGNIIVGNLGYPLMQ